VFDSASAVSAQSRSAKSALPYAVKGGNGAKPAQLFSAFAGSISCSLVLFLFLKQTTAYLLNILDHETTDVSRDKKSGELSQHLWVL
jgi:hypothetical protein